MSTATGIVISLVVGAGVVGLFAYGRLIWNEGAGKSTQFLSSSDPSSPLPSTLIPCITSHRRHLPIPAKHTFSYPLIYLGIDLDHLESGLLNLRSRFFQYGKKPWKSILGVQHEQYLSPTLPKPGPGSGGFKRELIALMESHGVRGDEVGRVWMVTMPSYLGLAGVNPLSVYFVYKKSESGESTPSQESEWEDLGRDEKNKASEGGRKLLSVVLEVHNTFEERHLYVLRVGVNEDKPEGNHDHAWVFPRTFHVSPFNNRAGFYRLDVINPFARGSVPKLKITLNQLTQDKQIKLYAALMNNPDKRKPPLDITARNIITAVLWRQPWDLFLTTFRILRQAWTLHYKKKLLVYPRPELHTLPRTEQSEPIGNVEDGAVHGLRIPWNPVETDIAGIGRSIGFRAVDVAEKKTERIILPLLKARVEELGICLKLDFADQSRKEIVLGNAGATEKDTLVIKTRHPTFWIQVLMAETPLHFLFTAEPDAHTYVSDQDMFAQAFDGSRGSRMKMSRDYGRVARWIRWTRRKHLLFLLSFCDRPFPPELIGPAPRHLFELQGLRDRISILSVLLGVLVADKMEEKIFRLVKARFVPGQEPWTVWKRAVDKIWQTDEKVDEDHLMKHDKAYGSILLEEVIAAE